MGDRNTMAFGVEGRSPFHDKDLVEYSIALKDDLKIKGGTLSSSFEKC